MKKILILLAFFVSTAGYAQTDTVIISLGRTSKIVFTMEDRNDLEVLKHYNFQQGYRVEWFNLSVWPSEMGPDFRWDSGGHIGPPSP